MPPDTDPLLVEIGRRLRARRRALGWSQARLARRAGLSPRFLGSLEAGRANVSVQRLADLCRALDLSFATLFRGLGPGAGDKVALVGLRGAGKSTIGAALARRLGWAFVEVDERVEALAGMDLGGIFEMSGEAHYRELESRVLGGLLARRGGLVLATGGGVVTHPESWSLLRERARTVWLRASPAAHLARVRAQGDLRPMAGRPNARLEIEAILDARAPLYAQAEIAVDTEALGVDGAVERIARWLGGEPAAAAGDAEVPGGPIPEKPATGSAEAP